MVNESSRQKLIQKILESKEFCNSSIYGNYLTYLTEATVTGKGLKETTIAMEFFGKDADFNPAEDTIVRSHTYTLRKKLETYYYTEGRKDKYRLVVPKGHYEISFELSENRKLSPRYLIDWSKKNYTLVIIALLAIFIVLLAGNMFSLKHQLKAYRTFAPDDFIWGEYMKSDLPVMIVTGDHFFFNMYIDEYKRTFSARDVMINSIEELQEFQTQYPEASIQVAPEPYFPYHSIWGLPPILATLFSAHQNPIMRKASSISPQILDEYNIIYVGSIKTLYALRHTISKSHFSYGISPHLITYSGPDSGSVRTFSTSLHSSGPNEDLVLALKLPGPSNNSVFIIASYHSLGAPEIARYLTQPETCNHLKNLYMGKLHHTPRFFEMLFKVVGIDKTAYDTEILIFDEILP